MNYVDPVDTNKVGTFEREKSDVRDADSHNNNNNNNTDDDNNNNNNNNNRNSNLKHEKHRETVSA